MWTKSRWIWSNERSLRIWMFSGSNLRALEWSRLGLASGKPFCGFHEFHKKDTKLQSCKWCTDFAPRHCGSTWRPARGLFQTRLDGDEGFELTKWANFITKKQNHKKTKAFLCQLANHINTQSLNRLNPNFNSIRCRRHHRRPNHPACLVVLAVLAIQEAKDLCSVHCCGSLFTQFSSAFDGVKCQTNKRFFLGLRFAYNVGTSEIISIHFFPTRLWRKDLHLDFGTKLNWQRLPWPSKFVDTKHPHMPTDVTLEVALYPLVQRSRRVNSPALPWFEMHGFMKFLSLFLGYMEPSSNLSFRSSFDAAHYAPSAPAHRLLLCGPGSSRSSPATKISVKHFFSNQPEKCRMKIKKSNSLNG